MIKVLATGTFDILHPGHITYLTKAKELGDELYVIVARDSRIKHKPKPIIPEEQRVKMVNALSVVDKAVLGSENDMFEPVKEIQPDIIALGANQHFEIKELEKKLKERRLKAKVVRIKDFEKCPLCSSGEIIKRIINKYNDLYSLPF